MLISYTTPRAVARIPVSEHRISVSVVTATYNERPNIGPLYRAVREALEPAWDFELIVVDDNSPDGTSEEVTGLAEKDDRVRLISRPGKLGLASALADGFRVAKGNYWVMMDADLSHRPQDIPQLLYALHRAPVAIGSRYVKYGGTEDWPIHRRWGSKLASALGRTLVGLPVRDLTSGYAAFQRDLMTETMPHLDPRGFKFLLDVLARNRDARVEEVPIIFVNRTQGKSKFGAGEIVAFFKQCWSLRRQRSQSAEKEQP